MTRRFERSVEYISETVWAIHPAALAMIIGIVGERWSGNRPSKEEIRRRIGVRDAAPETPVSSVAVIPISGPITPKASFFSEVSGATSINQLQAQFAAALADDAISAIVFDVDSPGGSVELVPEFADQVLSARGAKPIVAVANGWAASAAYWIASAADELVVTPSGQVGSIGVYTAHDDLSAAMAMQGVKKTFISAGPYKVEANPFAPLSDDAKAEMQRQVDAYYGMFVDAVAAGRARSAEDVKAEFGGGRMVMATDAVANGMADRVATLQATVRRLEDDAEAAALEAEPSPLETVLDILQPAASKAFPLPRIARRTLAPGEMVQDAAPPRHNLVRAMDGGLGLTDAEDARPVMHGYCAAFDEWAEIESAREGHFFERIDRKAADKTIAQHRDRMRVLFNHGRDPSIGNKVLGPIQTLRTDEQGVFYEVPLLDTSYNRDLEPGLRERLYGSSFVFEIDLDDMVWNPGRSKHNPDGIPERTIRQFTMREFGPVTWPAYVGATAGMRMRSLTDEFFPEAQERSGEPRETQTRQAVRGKTGSTPRARRTWLLSHRAPRIEGASK